MAGLYLQFYYLKILNNLTILFHNPIRGLQITLTQEWQKKFLTSLKIQRS